MSARAQSFGQAAERYEQFRLGYPDAVAELVLAYAQPPVLRAVEVGAGTGKATRLFAGRGVEVLACEPDPGMVAVLDRVTAGLPVRAVGSTYEELVVEDAVDLLFAAAAWHWTDPATRWDRAATLLRPGGTFASFGSGGTVRTLLEDPELQEAVAAAKAEVMPEPRFVSQERSASGRWWPGSELDERPDFTDVEELDVTRAVTCSRENFLGLVSTLSSYLVLGDSDRAEVLRRIGSVLPPTVVVRSDLKIHLGRYTP